MTLKTTPDDIESAKNRFLDEKPYPNRHFEVDLNIRKCFSDFCLKNTSFSVKMAPKRGVPGSKNLVPKFFINFGLFRSHLANKTILGRENKRNDTTAHTITKKYNFQSTNSNILIKTQLILSGDYFS